MSFQMQSWDETSAGRAWVPMENGPAASVWRPRKTAFEAALKCLTWTGLVCIPAMQVVDLASGAVVWRSSDRYPDAGSSILPSWHAQAEAAARAALKSDEVTEQLLPERGNAEPDLLDLLGSTS